MKTLNHQRKTYIKFWLTFAGWSVLSVIFLYFASWGIPFIYEAICVMTNGQVIRSGSPIPFTLIERVILPGLLAGFFLGKTTRKNFWFAGLFVYLVLLLCKLVVAVRTPSQEIPNLGVAVLSLRFDIERLLISLCLVASLMSGGLLGSIWGETILGQNLFSLVILLIINSVLNYLEQFFLFHFWAKEVAPGTFQVPSLHPPWLNTLMSSITFIVIGIICGFLPLPWNFPICFITISVSQWGIIGPPIAVFTNPQEGIASYFVALGFALGFTLLVSLLRNSYHWLTARTLR